MTTMNLVKTTLCGLFLTATLSGCGGAPSSLELCKSVCDANRRCGAITDTAAAACKSDCDTKSGALADDDRNNDKNCTNAGSVRSAYGECLTKECNKIDVCTQAIDTTCVPR